MLKICIIDDGVGVFPTLNKLKQSVSANYVCKILSDRFPLGTKRGSELFDIGKNALNEAEQEGFDVVVFSSIALSHCCYKKLSQTASAAFFSSEAPIMHSSMYTASKVLAVGDRYVTQNLNLPNVIACHLPEFYTFAETGDERSIVSYLNDNLGVYEGKFDCIALASSSMNMYKSCFSRVFPNVQIFDSIEGVARRIRKKYKKMPKDESTFTYLDGKNNDITEKYAFFIE